MTDMSDKGYRTAGEGETLGHIGIPHGHPDTYGHRDTRTPGTPAGTRQIRHSATQQPAHSAINRRPEHLRCYY